MIAVFTTLLAWALASILVSVLMARTAQLGPRAAAAADQPRMLTLDEAAKRAGVELNGASFDELNRLGHLVGIHTEQVCEPASPIEVRAASRSLSPIADNPGASRAA